VNCVRHPDRPVSPLDLGDRFCAECFYSAWNAGARWADAHWADQPHERAEGSNAPHELDRYTQEGLDVVKAHRGEYKRKPGDSDV